MCDPPAKVSESKSQHLLLTYITSGLGQHNGPIAASEPFINFCLANSGPFLLLAFVPRVYNYTTLIRSFPISGQILLMREGWVLHNFRRCPSRQFLVPASWPVQVKETLGLRLCQHQVPRRNGKPWLKIGEPNVTWLPPHTSSAAHQHLNKIEHISLWTYIHIAQLGDRVLYAKLSKFCLEAQV